MNRLSLLVATLLAVVPSILAAHARGQDAATVPADSPAMTARVDEMMEQSWQAAGVTPTRRTTDAEFLRRASLDLRGSIPRVVEVHNFLADPGLDKRAQLVDRLLANPRHANHLANTWLRIMLPDEDMRQVAGLDGFQRWLFERFRDNLRYDNLVADLLVARGSEREPGPALFFTSLELKPEEVAASTARIFLGLQIQCAQCHDHPFDHWKQHDFWGYAAFFARLKQGSAAPGALGGMRLVDADSGEVKIPDTDEVVPPKYPAGEMASDVGGSRRQQLAIWLVAKENPYFAKAAVNRVWAHLFGRGLVEPLDDLGAPGKHPVLLNELAAYFKARDFDLRDLIRTLVNTRAYQLSSEVPADADSQTLQKQEQLFARMSIKSLTAEQVFDCLSAATLRRPPAQQEAPPGVVLPGGGDAARAEFLDKFRTPGPVAKEFQAGIPQALTLMNGRLMESATDLEGLGILQALEAPFFTDEQRVETLFLATLARPLAPHERQQFVDYVTSGGATGDRRKALADVLWALLNSAEFILNH